MKIVNLLECSTCGENLGALSDRHTAWRRLKEGQAIHHCDGSTVAFGARQIGAHHTLNPWPNCWRCRQPLGCPKCVSCTPVEVLCESCLAWGTIAAFVHHGPITNDENQVRKRFGKMAPAFAAYPQYWQSHYANTEGMFYEHLELAHANTIQARRMIDVFSSAIPERYAQAIMQAWQDYAIDPRNEVKEGEGI